MTSEDNTEKNQSEKYRVEMLYHAGCDSGADRICCGLYLHYGRAFGIGGSDGDFCGRDVHAHLGRDILFLHSGKRPFFVCQKAVHVGGEKTEGERRRLVRAESRAGERVDRIQRRFVRSGHQAGTEKFRRRGRFAAGYGYPLFCKRVEAIGRNAKRRSRKNRPTGDFGRMVEGAVCAAVGE